jgi:hypothetical protein
MVVALEDINPHMVAVVLLHQEDEVTNPLVVNRLLTLLNVVWFSLVLVLLHSFLVSWLMDSIIMTNTIMMLLCSKKATNSSTREKDIRKVARCIMVVKKCTMVR